MLDKFKNNGGSIDADGQASSIDLVPIKSIINKELILLTDGTYRVILRAYPVNFDLKADKDKLRTIYGFGNLLNALTTDVPLQFLSHSKRLETESYVRMYQERLNNPNVSPQIKEFIQDHLTYFQETAMRHNLLQREFYVVIPYNPNKAENLSQGDGIADGAPFQGLVNNLLKREPSAEDGEQPKSMLEADTAMRNLSMRAGQIHSQLASLGVHSEIIREREIVSLFYEMFNPGSAERQKIRDIDTGPTSILSGPRSLMPQNQGGDNN